MECVQRLAELLAVPVGSGSVHDWDTVEGLLRLRLPDDYKRLVETFPDGWFQGLVQLNRPGDQDWPPDDFLGFYAYSPLGEMRSSRERGHGSFPYPIFPESGGVLPWARLYRLAGHLFWVTEGEDPNSWRVVLADDRFTEWVAFDGGACDFLLDLVEGRIDIGTPHTGPRFVPVSTSMKPAREPGPWYWKTVLPSGAGHPRERLTRLFEMLGPSAVAPDRVDWDAVARDLGFALPADYRSFIDAYGAGTFCDILIAAPNAVGPAGLADLMERAHARVVSSRGPHQVPIHPEPGGMVPWGETADGLLCCWIPFDQDPSRWGTILWLDNGLSLRQDESFSEFLVKYAEGERVFFPEPPWTGGPKFVAAR